MKRFLAAMVTLLLLVAACGDDTVERLSSGLGGLRAWGEVSAPRPPTRGGQRRRAGLRRSVSVIAAREGNWVVSAAPHPPRAAMILGGGAGETSPGDGGVFEWLGSILARCIGPS
jgi:hypothetical protein